MSEQKVVFNKLFKTELASQKVELALLDNISNFLKNYSVISDVAIVRQAAEKAEKQLNDKKQKLEQIIEQISKGQKISKELGISSDEFDKWKTFSEGQMKNTNSLIKNVQSAKFVDNI